MDRVVICPYCKRPSPEPSSRGLTHSCRCGAVFAAFEEEEMGSGLFRLVTSIFDTSSMPLDELLEECQVTVFPMKLEPFQDDSSNKLAEFIKEVRFEPTDEEITELNLVWVTKGEPNTQVNDLDSITN